MNTKREFTHIDLKADLLVCDCKFTPYKDSNEESFHYLRRCQWCGLETYSFHCPHDGIQRQCICGHRLQEVKGYTNE